MSREFVRIHENLRELRFSLTVIRNYCENKRHEMLFKRYEFF